MSQFINFQQQKMACPLKSLKVHYVIFVVFYFPNSCCPFTNVPFFLNTYHHHQIVSKVDLLHVRHYEIPEIDIFSCNTYCTLFFVFFLQILVYYLAHSYLKKKKTSNLSTGNIVSMSSIVAIPTLAT